MAGVSKLGQETWAWKKTHLYCTVWMEPSWTTDPNPHWGSRYKNRPHIDKLKASFREDGSINEHIKVVVCDDEAWVTLAALKVAGLNPNNIAPNWTGDPQLTVSALRAVGRGLETFAGNHSRTAVTELKQAYPLTDVYNKMKVDVYIAPNNKDTFRILRILSNQDNVQAALQLKQDFECVVEQTHRHRLAMMEENGGVVPQHIWIEWRNDNAVTLKCSTQAVTQIWTIASWQDALWDAAYQIIRGECQPPHGKSKPLAKPTSAYPFNMAAGVPDKMLLQAFHQVIDGKMDYGSLRKYCTTYKAKVRVRKDILQIVCALSNIEKDLRKERGDDFTGVRWKDLAAKFPGLGDKTFLAAWVDWSASKKVKDPLPLAFKEQVRAIMQRDSKQSVMYKCSVISCALMSTAIHDTHCL